MSGKYVISTGWWCTDGIDTRDKLLGDDSIREKDFFNLWYQSVVRFTSPEKILVVDSNSPVKPQLSNVDNKVEFISLDENAGHSTNHKGKYCGYTRGIFTGLGYALSCNVDYWVYVEQDALLFGDGIIEEAINNMKGDFLFGSGDGTPQVLQQSLIIMKTSFITKFLKNYSDINHTDNEVSPELKFACSCSPLFGLGLKYFLVKTKSSFINRVLRKVIYIYLKLLIKKNCFAFGYGRARPINFKDKFFYFQHGSKKELSQYIERL